MKLAIKNLFILFAVVMFLSSCKNDDSGHPTYYSYATVKGTKESFYLKADGNITLNVVRNNVPGFEVSDNMRVFLFFDKLEKSPSKSPSSSTDDKSWDIEILTMYSVLTKAPVTVSFLDTPARQDSIGHDPIDLYSLWTTEGYVNIRFDLLRNDPNTKHFINLVIDDEKSTSTDIYAELRHNAYNDAMYKPAKGDIAFPSNHFLNEDQDSVFLHVSYKAYGGETKSRKVTVKNVFEITPISVLNNNVVPSTLVK